MPGPTPTFSSRLAFVLVTAGAAVGLGNVWGFTYVAHKNGGGGFVLVYLAALALVALPVFMAELVLGRLAGQGPVRGLAALAREAGSRLPWQILAYLGVAGSLLVLSFYIVIAGEALLFGLNALMGSVGGWSPKAVADLDHLYKATPWPGLFWGGLFIALTAAIVSLDIRTGLERAGTYLMPLLFMLLLVLVVYAAKAGDMAAAFDFMFNLNGTVMTPHLLMEAVGQAFFTLSVGTTGIMLLGGYMGEKVVLVRAALWIALMDVAVALLAGFIIFPLVYEGGLDITPGPGLVYVTLPTLFVSLPFGSVAAVAFFLLLAFAAITSSIALLATPVSWLEGRGISRPRAAWGLAAAAFVLSGVTILSFNDWQDFYPLATMGLEGYTPFLLVREGVSNILLPLGGLGVAWIAGWRLDPARVQQALGIQSPLVYGVWRAAVRFLVPAAVIALFLNAILGGA